MLTGVVLVVVRSTSWSWIQWPTRSIGIAVERIAVGIAVRIFELRVGDCGTGQRGDRANGTGGRRYFMGNEK